MEHKNLLSVKTRIGELEKQHNRLTLLVGSMFRHIDHLRKRTSALENHIKNNNDINDAEIQKILTNDDSEDRTNKLLSELKKAQLNA